MLDSVPSLTAKQPGLLIQAAGMLSASVQQVIDQIEPYTDWWDDQNQKALGQSGPLMVVVGDSSALGIGASHPGRGYVGRLAAALSADQVARSETVVSDTTTCRLPQEKIGAQWRVVNLGQSGAKFEDGLQRQLPIVDQLDQIDLLICCLGTNDLVWSLRTFSLRKRAEAVVSAVGASRESNNQPTGVICAVAGKSPRAQLVNQTIASAANVQNLAMVNPWNEPGPSYSNRLASDRFHLNDLGYSLLAKAIGRTVGVETGDHEWSKTQGL